MLKALRVSLLVTATLAFGASIVMPDDTGALLLQLGVAVVTVGAVYAGVRNHRPYRTSIAHLLHPDPWELLGVTCVLRAVAELTSGAFFGLTMTAVTAYALVQMSRQRFANCAADHCIESIVTAGTISMLVWAFIIDPVLQSNGHPMSEGPASIIAVAIALVLASLAMRVALSFEDRPPALTILVVALALPVFGALAAFMGDYAGLPAFGILAGALPVLTSLLIGLAALEPSMSLYEEPSGPAGARLGRLRLMNLIAPVVIGPTLLLLTVLSADVRLSPVAISTFSILLTLLVVGHLILMVQARASSTHWASHDKLTGLPNRALFRDRAAQSLERSRKIGASIAILYVDLDRFKHINDSLGHEVGDQLLEQVAKRILSCVDAADTVARLGGDEFAILLPDIEGHEVPVQLARRLLRTFASPFNLKPRPVFMSPSVGISVGEGQASLETLLTQADTAMYRAKESGRNNFAVWSQEMNDASKERLMLETHLHSAITNDELRLVYQPKVELATGEVVGAEALIRWHHPTLGIISPVVFIQLAEEIGLIDQIGEWVLETACKQARAWYDSGFRDLTVAVNLSPRQFQHHNVADMVSRILRQTELKPWLLELELTESIAMSGDSATLDILNDLRSMGVRFSIDDFGTGYSNLSYLSRFPVDALKIDKAFVARIDEDDTAIPTAIIAMAHGLGLKVIAEGVETPEQAAFLASHDCDEMQGFLFSKPIPAGDLENLLMLEHVANGPGRLGVKSRLPQLRRLERPMPERERFEESPWPYMGGSQSDEDPEVVESRVWEPTSD